jgi:hypothetical protein
VELFDLADDGVGFTVFTSTGSGAPPVDVDSQKYSTSSALKLRVATLTCSACLPITGQSLMPPGQRKRTFNVARPKIFRPPDFAATMTTPVRVAGSSDLIRPLNSMSVPSVADTIAGWDSRTA